TEKPLEILPFYRTAEWVVFRKDGDIFKFNRIEAITPANENHPFEFETDDGHDEKWYRTLNFFCLMPSEMEDGTIPLPYLVSFRSTSARAGAQLYTIMYKKNAMRRAVVGREHERMPAGTVVELCGEKVKNEKGTFIVMKIKEKRPSKVEEFNIAYEW